MQVEVYGLIYKITNNINGKVYIGQTTTDFGRRYSAIKWWRACRNLHLKYSVEKYGSENFTIDKKIDIAISKEQLDEKEIYWIKFFKSTNPKRGYNQRNGGANGSPTKETLARITKANIRNALRRKGLLRSTEICLNIKKAKHELFIQRFTNQYSKTIQDLLNQNIRKRDICIKCDISMWQLDKIINVYSLRYESSSSMKGNFGKKHHSFGKHNTIESKTKISDTANEKREVKYGKEIENINKMLKDKVSISEISRVYGCGRSTMRKVIKHYGLESFGFNVKKHKIAQAD